MQAKKGLEINSILTLRVFFLCSYEWWLSWFPWACVDFQPTCRLVINKLKKILVEVRFVMLALVRYYYP